MYKATINHQIVIDIARDHGHIEIVIILQAYE